MAEITYTESEARRLLGPQFDLLLETGTLRVGAKDLDGRPLFFGENLRRAAAELTFLSSERPRGRPRRDRS